MDSKGSCFGQQATVGEVKRDDPTSMVSYSLSKYVIKGNVVVVQAQGKSGPGRPAFVQIYSSTSLDPRTGKGKLSSQAYLHQGKSKLQNGAKVTTYKIKIFVAPDFGIPGAFIMKSNHKHEFFLESASLDVPDGRTIHFDCRSWVYPFQMTKQERVFFSNTSYLPNKTPITLAELRKVELSSLRESGSGERKEWDRIYDYDYYNDLDDPSKGLEGIRPVLGGSKERPYPRRGGTGTSNRSLSGMINLDAYVPPDERLSQCRLSEIIANSIQASLSFLIPETKHLLEDGSGNLESFEDITDLFTSKRNQLIEEKLEKILKKLVPDVILKKLINASKDTTHIKPHLPQIIAENELAWRSDEEFGRQMLAGANPSRISSLQMFPPQGKNGESTIKASDIETNLDGLTLIQAINEWRIFVLDHHDYLMPFLSRINTNDVCAYASRTLLFLRSDNTLKPVAIELSLPGSSKEKEISWVFRPVNQGTEAAIWQMAKAHVAANDSAYHQLVGHWLHTHAVIEPIVIATRRQLSSLHPVHRLLDPHYKDTMHINALARRILLNAGGIFEKTLYSREVSMELSSELYKEWRFDEQALPVDLVKRGLALEDPDSPIGVQLLFQDYPYGADGLDIWQAIKTWVSDFCRVFYTDNDSIKSDKEIQAWWSEVRNVGHGDKCNSTGWWRMTTLCHLIDALTTIIWITSAHHAAISFGQYAYNGCPLNRPMLCRKFIPEEGTRIYAEFLTDPEKYFLSMLPERFEMTLGIALAEVLSEHAAEEVYLGQRSLDWTDNKEVEEKFKRFQQELHEIEKKIFSRNADPELKNRRGPANIPYELLLPSRSVARSNMCLVGKGIPNSISI